MTSSHGRRIQSRRALAILAWLSLVVVAGLLWYAQNHRIIRIQAWEPAALLLSAYTAFLSIFAWLLFSPERKSAEESPALFFAGMLTLLPPCFIAYYLMPPESPLRGWLTIGIFLFGAIAVLSPLPEDVFAIPRHRRSYLQPLTDSYLSVLNVDAPTVSFEQILPQTVLRLTQPAEAEAVSASPARDPWADPFIGTGRRMSRIGPSRSRQIEESNLQESSQPAQDRPRAVARPTVRETPIPPAAGSAQATLRELDHQLRLMNEADDEDSETIVGDVSTTGATPMPIAGVSQSGLHTAGGATLERIRDEHGGEMIEGTIPVFFEIGQKRAHLHVPFSPPLPGLPEVECEPVGEDSVRLKVAVRQPYGIRIEARRSEASESLKTEISFAAVYTPGLRRS